MVSSIVLFLHHPLATVALALWSLLGLGTWSEHGNLIENTLTKLGYEDVVFDFDEVWSSHTMPAPRPGPPKPPPSKNMFIKNIYPATQALEAPAPVELEMEAAWLTTTDIPRPPPTEIEFAHSHQAEAHRGFCEKAEEHRGKWYHTPYGIYLHYVCEAKPEAWNHGGADGCREGWTSFKGSCYMAELEKVAPIKQAIKFCGDVGAELVTIETEDENDFVKDLVGRQTIWIGVTKSEGKWTWADGSPLKYDNFDHEQPKDDSDSESAFMNYWGALCMPPPWQKALTQFIILIVIIICIPVVILSIVVPCIYTCSYKKHVTNRRQTIPDFRAWAMPQSPLAPAFRFPLFSCCKDLTTFWHSCCCMQVRAADSHHVAGTENFWHIILWYFASQCIGQILGQSAGNLIAGMVMAAVMTGKRQELKARLGIVKGSSLEDFMLWWCCTPCVVAQEALEVDNASGVQVGCCCSFRQLNTAASNMVGPAVSTPPGWLAAQPFQAAMQMPEIMSSVPAATAPPRFGTQPTYHMQQTTVVPPPPQPVSQAHCCATEGCNRESFNGRYGQSCCRTCWYNEGRKHGPECEMKAANAAQAATAPQHASAPFIQHIEPPVYSAAAAAAASWEPPRAELAQPFIRQAEVISIEPPAGHQGQF